MSYHQSKNRSFKKMISRIPSCWREDDHRCITYTGAWCNRATDKEVRSTRAERKGGTNVHNERVVCYAKCLMHGLRKWRDTHHRGRTQPSKSSQSRRAQGQQTYPGNLASAMFRRNGSLPPSRSYSSIVPIP